jgi:hypothetical protein
MILLVFLNACAPKQQPATAPATDAATAVPDGKELFARHLEAIGGEAALRSHTNMVQHGTLSLPAQSITGPMEIRSGAPDLYYFEFEIPHLGSVEEGYYGDGLGWQKDPMTGPALKRGPELDDIAFRSKFYSDAEYAQLYTSFHTVGEVTWAGEPCWQVEATRTSGRSETHYFSEATGLRVGLQALVPTAMGDIGANLELYDYREEGGLKTPRRLVDTKGPNQTILQTESVTIDDPSFALPPLPDDVKALVDAQKQ